VVLDFGAATMAGILTKPVAATASSFAGNLIIGPSGHRFETICRKSGFDTTSQLRVRPLLMTMFLIVPHHFHCSRV
jgi:hypothetical protein